MVKGEMSIDYKGRRAQAEMGESKPSVEVCSDNSVVNGVIIATTGGARVRVNGVVLIKSIVEVLESGGRAL